VEFRLGVKVTGLTEDAKGQVSSVETQSEESIEVKEGCAVVIAAGCQSVHIAKSLGIGLPLYPMLGYSLTMDVKGLPADGLPRGLLILEPLHLYVIRMDAGRVRFASIAQFAGWNEQLFDPAPIEALNAASNNYHIWTRNPRFYSLLRGTTCEERGSLPSV